MKIPVLRGMIDRRLLINYRVEPEVLRRLLPPPFEPQLVEGWGVAGICLIRLTHLRPVPLPGVVGLTSESAAHRIAVRWRDGRGWRTGVFIPRRDTASRFNTFVGGRLVPGYHRHARFWVAESDPAYHIAVRSDDGQVRIEVQARRVEALPAGSIFPSLAVVSEFFQQGSVGYSPGAQAGAYQGLQLESFRWAMEPLAVTRGRSSFFEDARRFPAGSCVFDCALLMRAIDHAWHSQLTICATCATA